jgi:hypothetical protein
MMPALERAKEGITAVFSSIDKDLLRVAKELSSVDLKKDAARQILKELCNNHKYLIDCAIVDISGKMIVIEPEGQRGFEGSDISNQRHIATLLNYKKPVFSDVFHSVEGADVTDFEYPIFSDKKEFLGAVSMLVKQEALSADVIVPIVYDIPCKIWIMQKDGLIIYDPDPNQIGRNLFSDELFRPFQDLVSFSRTVALTKNGAGSYDFYAKGLDDKTLVKKYAAWDTVSLYGTEWRIIVMEIEKQAPPAKETK